MRFKAKQSASLLPALQTKESEPAVNSPLRIHIALLLGATKCCVHLIIKGEIPVLLMKQYGLYIICRESTTLLEPRGVVCLKSTNVSESLSPLMRHLFLKGPLIKMEQIHKNVLRFLKWTRFRLVMLGKGKSQGS